MEVLDEGKPIEGGAMDSLLARIVDEYAPESDTFDVVLALEGANERFPFRRLTDGKAWEDLQKDATAYALAMRPKKAGKMKVVPMSPEMARWSAGVKPEIFAQVYVITRLALVPAFQSEPGVMMMYRRVWPVFKSITSQIDAAMTNQLVDAENDDYEDEKKGSEIGDTEPGSRSPGEPSGDTTTTSTATSDGV